MSESEMPKQNLEERVLQFNALKLPGQPMAMHMGTCYLVNDLWREVEHLQRRADLAAGVAEAAEDAQRAFEAMLAPLGSLPHAAVSPQFMRDKMAAALSAYRETRDG